MGKCSTGSIFADDYTANWKRRVKQKKQPYWDSTAKMCIYIVSKGSIKTVNEPEARRVLQSIVWLTTRKEQRDQGCTHDDATNQQSIINQEKKYIFTLLNKSQNFIKVPNSEDWGIKVIVKAIIPSPFGSSIFQHINLSLMGKLEVGHTCQEGSSWGNV